tara:strand:+ start:139468 stop:139686 length:219 start_codon:yes stop_codon:yes gene_type:complete
MSTVTGKMIEDPQDILAYILKPERALIILASAVTAYIPRKGMKRTTEGFELPVPIKGVAPNAMQKQAGSPLS